MNRLHVLFFGFLCTSCVVIDNYSSKPKNTVSRNNSTQYAFRYYLDLNLGINPKINNKDSMEVTSDFQKNKNIYRFYYFSNDSTMNSIKLELPFVSHNNLDSIHDSTILKIEIDGAILEKESNIRSIRLKYLYKKIASLSKPDSVKYLLVESKYESGFSHSIFIPKILLDYNLELLGFVFYDGLENKTYIYRPQNTYDIFYLLR